MRAFEIMQRRKRILELVGQTLRTKSIIDIIVSEYEVSERTVKRDIRDIDKWLPELLKMGEDSNKVKRAILSDYEAAKMRFKTLMYTADNSNAQVGAGRSLIVTLGAETEFRRATGQLSLEPQVVKVEGELIDVEFSFPEIFAEFGEAIVGDAVRRRLHADRGDPPETVQESVDTKEEP